MNIEIKKESSHKFKLVQGKKDIVRITVSYKTPFEKMER